MSKINLLFIITKLELGGAQKQLLSLIRNIDKDRYNVFLVSAARGLLLDDVLSIPGIRVKTFWALERPINPLKDILALILIYHFIKRNKIDVVHTHSSKAGIVGRWAARLAGVDKIIHTVHGWSFNDYQNRLISSFFICLENLTSKITDNLIVVSDYDMQKGLRHHIAGEAKYRIVRYGIDFEESKKIDESGSINIRAQLGLFEKNPLITMVSCLKPQKAPLDYVEAARLVLKSYPLVRFILVGDGLLRGRVERLIERYRLEDKITLLGWRRDIFQIINNTDIFVLTSLWEGLPIAVLEAMACARPVVVTNSGAISDIIKDGINGLLASPGDVRGIANRIMKFLGNEELKLKLGKAASQSIDSNFAIKTVLSQTEGLYRRSINNRESLNVN